MDNTKEEAVAEILEKVVLWHLDLKLMQIMKTIMRTKSNGGKTV